MPENTEKNKSQKHDEVQVKEDLSCVSLQKH
jgi:hypothetical protein